MKRRDLLSVQEDTTMGEEVRGEDIPEDEKGAEEEKEALKASEIDAYWLQRQVSKAFGFSDSEAEKARKLANDAFDILSKAKDDREAENELVLLLNYEKFDLIKVRISCHCSFSFHIHLAFQFIAYLLVLVITFAASAEEPPQDCLVHKTRASG